MTYSGITCITDINQEKYIHTKLQNNELKYNDQIERRYEGKGSPGKLVKHSVHKIQKEEYPRILLHPAADGHRYSLTAEC